MTTVYEVSNQAYLWSLNAEANCQYHELLASLFWWLDFVLRLVTAILTVVTCIFMGYELHENVDPAHRKRTFRFGLGAVLFGVLASALPFIDSHKQEDELVQRWTDFREDCEKLIIHCDASGKDNDEARLYFLNRAADLTGRRSQIEEDESAIIRPLFNWCEKNVNQSRTGKRHYRPEGEAEGETKGETKGEAEASAPAAEEPAPLPTTPAPVPVPVQKPQFKARPGGTPFS